MINKFQLLIGLENSREQYFIQDRDRGLVDYKTAQRTCLAASRPVFITTTRHTGNQ